MSWKVIPKANHDASQSNRSTTTSSADWQQKRFGAAARYPVEIANHVRKGHPRMAVLADGELLSVEQEVGGSSPPNCTKQIKYLKKISRDFGLS